MRTLSFFASLLLAATAGASAPAVAAPAGAGLHVERAWARPTPPGAKVGAAFLEIRNDGAADRLASASTPAAAAVELHAHVMDGGVATMRAVPGIDVPAGGSVEFAPGGLHLMLIGLKAPLKPGHSLLLKLRFAKAGEIAVRVEVGEPAAGAAAKPPGAGHGEHAGH